jgi:hypothetical protein
MFVRDWVQFFLFRKWSKIAFISSAKIENNGHFLSFLHKIGFWFVIQACATFILQDVTGAVLLSKVTEKMPAFWYSALIWRLEYFDVLKY